MNKRKLFFYILICFVVISGLVSLFSQAKPTKAGTINSSTYITIDTPTSNAVISSDINISGYIYSPSAPVDVYLYMGTLKTLVCHISQAYTLNYSCLWKPTANGTYSLQAETNIGGVIYYSGFVPVTVNLTTIINPTPTPTPTPSTTSQNSGSSSNTSTTTPPTTSETPSPTSSTETDTTTTPTPSPTTTITGMPIPGRPDLGNIPVVVPVTPTPTGAGSQDIISGSKILETIKFKLDQTKPLHLSQIEQRQSSTNQKFLYFVGKSMADSIVTIRIYSQPLVMTTKTDAQGNWTYVLEKPLEPGKHEVYVQVNSNGQEVQSGPYPFSVAKAMASSNNPAGASLDLIDQSKIATINYLIISGEIIALAVLGLLIYLYRKNVKKPSQTIKAANAKLQS